MLTYAAILTYGLLVLGLAYNNRTVRTVDSFLMAERSVSTMGVGAATFSLVGGGEIVALTSLAFLYGPSAISLFIGYALGFFLLGLLSNRIRGGAEKEMYVSLPDYMYKKCGNLAGFITFLCSLGAFFSLLMLQLSAGGLLLSQIGGVEAASATIAIGILVTSYLAIGGFRTVISTDMLQGASRMLLVPFLGWAAYSQLSLGSVQAQATMPTMASVGMILTGFFTAMASADVWQRVYAAKSSASSRNGLWLGGLLMLLFGVVLVQLGIHAFAVAPSSVADDAFVSSVRLGLPEWASLLAVILVLISVISTADTEIFLVSSLLQSERRRRSIYTLHAGDSDGTVNSARGIVVVVGILSTLAALVFSDLVTIYLWLISALLVLSPIVIASLIFSPRPITGSAALVFSGALFIGLVVSGALTLENAYLIVLPGFGAVALIELYFRVKR